MRHLEKLGFTPGEILIAVQGGIRPDYAVGDMGTVTENYRIRIHRTGRIMFGDSARWERINPVINIAEVL